MDAIMDVPMDAQGSRRIRVVADVRERGSDLLRRLKASRLVDLRITTLGTGDYVIEEQVTIERRTQSDFAIALVDGRLFQQAARLTEMSRPLVLVEGDGASSLQLARGGYRPKRLKNRQPFVLQGLPGIGPVLPRRLLQRFGTVRA